MTTSPYRSFPKTSFWRPSVAELPVLDVDPVSRPKFVIERSEAVATAGSCFAQHIARHLSRAGFNFLVTETAHPLLSSSAASKLNYNLFTARYANIYTTRQLIQLLQRAYGLLQPLDDIWHEPDGTFLDPYRPTIQPGGFMTIDEFYGDRETHFAAVRQAIENLDCFVFTLGLTECWINSADGLVYPVCPGVSGGAYEPSMHQFLNLSTADVLADLAEVRNFILQRNTTAKFILTVSPVPLVATASTDHVLVATTMSKSVLRAAAGEFSAAHANVDYFPSYEIITGSFNRGAYFGADLRSVEESGVNHVMRLFLKHYGNVTEDQSGKDIELHEPRHNQTTQELIKVVCEEEALQQFST